VLQLTQDSAAEIDVDIGSKHARNKVLYVIQLVIQSHLCLGDCCCQCLHFIFCLLQQLLTLSKKRRLQQEAAITYIMV
jgi:hypothetical protein